MQTTLSQEIKNFLKEYSLTQEQFALECDLPQCRINAIIHEKVKTPKAETIAKIKQGMQAITGNG